MFDTITCRELKVVDKNGKTAVALYGYEGGNSVLIKHENGKPAIQLISGVTGNFINIHDKNGKEAITLASDGDYHYRGPP